MNELELARTHVAQEIVDALRDLTEEPDYVRLNKVKGYITDALRDYERAILRTAGVVVKE